MEGRRKITLAAYVSHRLGRGSDLQLLRVMLRRSFGAGTFRAFWQYWNPVYGYYLYRLCYGPLRAVFPRPLCVLATFAACGFFLHDLPFGWGLSYMAAETLPFPLITVWFMIIALIVIATEIMRINLKDKPLIIRVPVNIAYLAVSFALAMMLAQTVS